MNGAVDLPLDAPETSFEASDGATVRRSVLPSGVRVLSEHVPAAHSVTLGFWVGVGSRDERTGVAGGHTVGDGSTHFLEHLLFKGTPGRSALDIAVAFDSVGGEHNAVTAKEHTCYYAKVRDRDAEMAIEVLADMITSSVLDPAEFENERGVILEELAMADDDPVDCVGERLFEAVFGDHPLGRPIGGRPETIRAARRDAVWEHYRAHYRPNDLVVTAAGAIDHASLVDAVTRGLTRGGWDLGAAASPTPRRDTAEVALEAPQPMLSVRRGNEQANLMLGMPGLVATDERRPVLALLNSILGGGMSSRLFQEVRERRGLAYAVYSFAPGYADSGLFGLYAGCTPAKAPEVVRLLGAELEGIAADGVGAHELARAYGQLSGGGALALEDTDTRMARLGRAELVHGEFIDFDENLRRLALVTIDDVTALASDLANRPRSLAVVGDVADDAIEAAA